MLCAHTFGRYDKAAAFFAIPVLQHKAGKALAVGQGVPVGGRAVSVAVDKIGVGVLRYQGGYRFFGYVGNGTFAVFGFTAFAHLADLLRQQAAFSQGLGEDGGLPLGLARLGAELHIGQVGGAEFVAVGEQLGTAVEDNRMLLGQQGHAAAAGEVLAEQEIAVAGDEIHGFVLGECF